MKRNMPKREIPDFEEDEKEKIELDVDDVLVRPIDGVIIGGDEEEIKLLFFYLKPESYYEDEETTQCRCVVELRMSSSKFLNISRELNERVKDLERGRTEIPMFA